MRLALPKPTSLPMNTGDISVVGDLRESSCSVLLRRAKLQRAPLGKLLNS